MKTSNWLSLVIILGLSQVTLSQVAPRGPAGERVEQLKKLRLMEALKLDEETSIRFFSRYNEHQEELREIGRKRNDLVDDLQILVRKNGPESDIEAKIKDVNLVESEVAAARAKFLGSLKGILTQRQIGAYVVFERKFNQDLRELMREATQERFRGRNQNQRDD